MTYYTVSSIAFDESKLSLEELFKRHPLVTNPAFFKVDYFPNVTPASFDKIDSWVV